jgi:hypothetical protein
VNDRQTRYVARRESLIFCGQLSEPSSFRRFSRRFGRRPPAKNLAAFIEDFSLVSAAPKLNSVQPSPVDTRSLHLCHSRCLTRRCDLNIAVPPGKLPQAAQRAPRARTKTMRRFCTFAWQCNLGRFIRRQASISKFDANARSAKAPVIVVIPVARPVVAIARSVAVNRPRHHSNSGDYVGPLWGY